jgi:RNA polymerase sigma-70 factor (ECF subfamily)
MLQFQAGDTEAFDQLVQRNVNNVHALVYRFLGESSMVEDITQEAFLRIYRNVANYKPTAKFSTWLYRIVANLCFNVIRSRKKSRPVSLDSAGWDEDARRDVPDPQAPPPDHRMKNGELRDRIASAVGGLPENQRIAIVLHKYEDKSYQEIADVLETTTMAVKSLLSRARVNLRDRLKPYLKER